MKPCVEMSVPSRQGAGGQGWPLPALQQQHRHQQVHACQQCTSYNCIHWGCSNIIDQCPKPCRSLRQIPELPFWVPSSLFSTRCCAVFKRSQAPQVRCQLAGCAAPSLVLLQIGPDYVDFDRPLAFNVSTGWNPEIHSWVPFTRTQCGIEKLTIEFPWTPYAGMNKEQGWNALNFWWTPHGWVDDVTILNAGKHFMLSAEAVSPACSACTPAHLVVDYPSV